MLKEQDAHTNLAQIKERGALFYFLRDSHIKRGLVLYHKYEKVASNFLFLQGESSFFSFCLKLGRHI